MLAPSASEPTMVPLVLGVARTFSGVPLVFTVPDAAAEATENAETPASRTPVSGTSRANLGRRRIRGTRAPRREMGAGKFTQCAILVPLRPIARYTTVLA